MSKGGVGGDTWSIYNGVSVVVRLLVWKVLCDSLELILAPCLQNKLCSTPSYNSFCKLREI